MSNEKKWKVELSPDHPSYQRVFLNRPSDIGEGYSVVMACMKKLMHYTEKGPREFIVPPVEQWSEGKKNGLFHFLEPIQAQGVLDEMTAVPMPVISFNLRSTVETKRKWLFFDEQKLVDVSCVEYVNGRHRARYLSFAGAKSIPVLCDDASLKDFIEHCGKI